MSSNCPLRLFTLECDDKAKKIIPHIRYIAPDNVLQELYKILKCELVTCTEVSGKLFDVWSDDEALLKANPIPNLYIADELIIFGSVALAKSDEEGKVEGLNHAEIHLLWDFALNQFPKLLNFLGVKRR